MYVANPAQLITAAGGELRDLDHDLSKVCNAVCLNIGVWVV